MTELPAPQLRIGDADRQHAAAALGEHLAAGRLELDEYDERVASAYAARTSGDLSRLFVDLPDTAGRRTAYAGGRPRRERSRRRPAVPALVLVLVAVVVLPALVLAAHVFPFVLFALMWFWWGGHSRRRRAWR